MPKGAPELELNGLAVLEPHGQRWSRRQPAELITSSDGELLGCHGADMLIWSYSNCVYRQESCTKYFPKPPALSSPVYRGEAIDQAHHLASGRAVT